MGGICIFCPPPAASRLSGDSNFLSLSRCPTLCVGPVMERTHFYTTHYLHTGVHYLSRAPHSVVLKPCVN